MSNNNENNATWGFCKAEVVEVGKEKFAKISGARIDGCYTIRHYCSFGDFSDVSENEAGNERYVLIGSPLLSIGSKYSVRYENQRGFGEWSDEFEVKENIMSLAKKSPLLTVCPIVCNVGLNSQPAKGSDNKDLPGKPVLKLITSNPKDSVMRGVGLFYDVYSTSPTFGYEIKQVTPYGDEYVRSINPSLIKVEGPGWKHHFTIVDAFGESTPSEIIYT